MCRDPDPLGYYRVLGVEPSAASDEIKKQFKAKAQLLHPDKNRADEATAQFQLLNEAYHVLGDAQARANYDAGAYTREECGPEAAEQVFEPIEPITCSICDKISTQPRYVIYRQVASALFRTRPSVYQGVLCAKCGSKQANKASLTTWALGWWGMPWGPILSVQAIFRNMLGGEQPALVNFRILATQAFYFASIGQMSLAQGIANDALRFFNKIDLRQRAQDSEMHEQLIRLFGLFANSDDGDPDPALRDRWGFGSKAFLMQLGIAMIPVIALLIAISSAHLRGTASRHVRATEEVSTRRLQTSSANTPTASRQHVAEEPSQEARQIPPFEQPEVALPQTGKIEALWSTRSRPVLVRLKVIARSGSPNYYAKIVDWATQEPVLIFFIRSGEAAQVRVPVGNYEIHFAAGEKWFGEEYLFGPTTEYTKAERMGVLGAEANPRFDFRAVRKRVAGFTLELPKQPDGNVKQMPIQASEF